MKFVARNIGRASTHRTPRVDDLRVIVVLFLNISRQPPMTIDTTLDERNREYAWSFREEVRDEMADFIDAFTEYNAAVNPELPVEDFTLLDSAAVVVKFYGIPENDSATAYVDMEVSIQSKNGRPLRFLDFLFRLHALVAPYLEDADHEFYEGLTFVELRDGVPVLELMQGS